MLIAAMGAQAALVYVYGDKKKQKKSIVVSRMKTSIEPSHRKLV